MATRLSLFLVQRSIYAQGLKTSLFFTRPFIKAFDNLPDDNCRSVWLRLRKIYKIHTKEMSKINIRSPYYVTQSDTGLESLQIELWIYTGTRVASTYPTTDPTYTLTTTAIDDSATFEISELIKDYLDSSFDGTYTSSAVFVDYRLTKTVSGVTFCCATSISERSIRWLRIFFRWCKPTK